ncbi:MAG: hypothetical protein CFH01_00225 [Alphaproteobacteria bacterium MarineAlpha2_Bin1]|nr:MAG: hypothetical protein CFH01_00225 [Alphaproteobacteria bacterium MarineAlpha2_Bin1]|tara:strand:- start:149 stop:667 length:519 start_codon:yes stop_codon:yes gene_type:complete
MKISFNKIILLLVILLLISGCSDDIVNFFEIENNQKISKKDELSSSIKKSKSQKNKNNKVNPILKETDKKFVNKKIYNLEKKDKTDKIKKTISDHSFIGMEYTELIKLIGDPYIYRKDYPEEVAVYKNDLCIMHFFLSEYSSKIYKKINFVYIDTKKNKKNTCIESFLKSNK